MKTEKLTFNNSICSRNSASTDLRQVEYGQDPNDFQNLVGSMETFLPKSTSWIKCSRVFGQRYELNCGKMSFLAILKNPLKKLNSKIRINICETRFSLLCTEQSGTHYQKLFSVMTLIAVSKSRLKTFLFSQAFSSSSAH